MATVDSILLGKASGHVGKQVVYKQFMGKTLLTKYPDMSKRVLSAKQIRVNETMELACYNAQGIIADEALRNEAQIRLNVPRNRLYPALIREYFANEKAKAAKTE